jgi:hypothetical protein
VWSRVARAAAQVHHDLWHHGRRPAAATWLAVCPGAACEPGQESRTQTPGLDSVHVDGGQASADDPDHAPGPCGTARWAAGGATALAAGGGVPEAADNARLPSGEAAGANGGLAPAPGARAHAAGTNGGSAAAARGGGGATPAAAPVRPRAPRSVWAPMEFEAMPRWGFMDWLRFYFYRRG